MYFLATLVVFRQDILWSKFLVLLFNDRQGRAPRAALGSVFFVDDPGLRLSSRKTMWNEGEHEYPSFVSTGSAEITHTTKQLA